MKFEVTLDLLGRARIRGMRRKEIDPIARAQLEAKIAEAVKIAKDDTWQRQMREKR